MSILIGSVAIFLILLVYLNPYRYHIDKLTHDHLQTLHFGVYVDVYDLSVDSAHVERLFVIKPENVMLYNVNGNLFYYLQSTNLLCPNEFTVVRFNTHDINLINKDNFFSTMCTNISSLSLYEHFITLKNNVPDTKIILSVHDVQYSVLDIVNMLLLTGYVFLN
ncbi:PIF-4 [Urbanus proteus nucleopolyhedrovirus]|uniref:PIF-4 n=1 Tax=Urbanus proteus nucleopolyhedrovirus TaxID=1675866 RepID=A0A1W6AYI8_9ABAC|nr:PIF-4 [Urbanus proteus nucleopolyhedrovirus]ARJ36575.1 PIF-4 [Urbanus proteus nucleopolyhedrovirus]